MKVESEESKHMKLIYQLENQLKQLKEEVTSVPAVITESDGVKKTVDMHYPRCSSHTLHGPHRLLGSNSSNNERDERDKSLVRTKEVRTEW